MSAAPPDPADANLHGCYAGAASRLAAYLIDAAVSSGAFVVGLAVAAYAVDVITGRSVSWSKQNAV
nr:hypothetical protein [Actinomycetota bacterium]